MLEVSYEYGKAQEESTDPVLDLVKKIEDYETTFFIYFNLDRKNIEITSKKFSSNHPVQYLLITEKGNVLYYSPSTIDIGNIAGIVHTVKKDGNIAESDKKTIIVSLNKTMGGVDFKDKIGIKSIVSEIEKIFYTEKTIIKNGKETRIAALKDKYNKVVINIKGKSNFYTIGFIKDERKYLLAELDEYKKFLFGFKFGNRKERLNENQKIAVCDFCGEEKELVGNFGQSNPYKLGSLKMFGSTFAKGFYSLDNSDENLYKTIRCCHDCIKKLQKVDSSLFKNHHIAQLKQITSGKVKTNPVNIYLFIHKISGNPISPDESEEIIDAVELLFGTKSLDNKLKNISTIKDKLWLDKPEDLVVDLFFNIGTQQKNQVIHEARNLAIKNIYAIANKLSFLSEARNILMPDSNRFYSIQYMFELISLFNYKVSIDVIKSFFHKKVPLAGIILKGMLKHIRSSVYDSFPEKIGYIYHTLTLDLSLMFSFIALLSEEDYKMEKITKDLVLERYEKNGKTKVRAKPIKDFVEKIYADITTPEIALMEIGEIICDIANQLYHQNKKDREKVFFEKIDFTGMDNKNIEKFLVFISGKINQYYMDLKYIKTELAEKLNRITIEVNNNNLDKIKSVLRIVDGYNLKKRINIMSAITNKEDVV